MKLKELLAGISTLSQSGNLDAEVTGLTQDSQNIKPGNIFFAIKGTHFDGPAFIPQAFALGATAVICSKASKAAGALIQVESVRDVIAPIASRFYGAPSEKLYLTGVTGTNGKTTTTYMIEAILESGVIGTIDFHYKNFSEASTHTTPDGIKIQSLLSHFQTLGAKSVAMEVSSHGLIQKRIESLQFDSAVFTNLTRDHLDFHGTMEEYVKAKALLFNTVLEQSTKKNKRAILNREDLYFEKLLPPHVPLWTYGFLAGDFKVLGMNMTLEGTELELRTPIGVLKTKLHMVGRHNVANAMGAIAVAVHHGLSLEKIATQLDQLLGVPGRLQRVQNKNSGVRVFVDYAHTDDGLRKVLGFLNSMRDELSPNSKIITVFGCGGDRDKGKRPLMMKAALEGSDRVVVTSDNPRTEDPNLIIADIVRKAPKSEKFTVDADRRQAIQLALEQANSGDIVLIAGKGHENFQNIGGKLYPFDDASIAKEILDA